MIKDTFYFAHDYEPTSDPKIQALIGEHGGLGYGIYWRLVEMLHSCNTHKLCFKKYIISSIAKQMLTTVEQVNEIINSCIDYELFIKEQDFFYSQRVFFNIEKRNEIRNNNSKAGIASAEKRRLQRELLKVKLSDEIKSTPVEQPFNDGLTDDAHTSTDVQHFSTKKEKKEKKEINIEFDVFWNLYDKKVGDKSKLTLNWNSLTDEERSLAINHIPKYKEVTQDKKYRKDPSTYLNNKSFNDEIIQRNNIEQQVQSNPIELSSEPKREYWQIHYGHLASTKEEFMQLLADGKIED